VHEYTHELYEYHVHKPLARQISQAKSDKYMMRDGKWIQDACFPPDTEMVERVINEGLAIWAETAACREIANDPLLYGVEHDDLKHIQTFIMARRFRFQADAEKMNSEDPNIKRQGRSGTCYNEGFALVESIFKSGGTEAVAELFQKIDPVKVALSERNGDEYQSVLRGDVSLLSMFGRKVIATS